MKKWTVMMIPHGKGATRNLSLSSFYIWALVASFCVLAFASTFTLQLYRNTRVQVRVLDDELERTTFQLRTARGVVHRIEGISPMKWRPSRPSTGKITRRASIPYSKLNRLYELESQIAKSTICRPRCGHPPTTSGTGWEARWTASDLSEMVTPGDDELSRPSN